MHTSGKEIADEIDRVAASIDFTGDVPHHAHVATTGVVDPANVAYTQADQTALAHQFLALVADHNLLIDQLITAGIMAAS